MKKEGKDSKKTKLEEALRQNLLRRKESTRSADNVNSNFVEGDKSNKEAN